MVYRMRTFILICSALVLLSACGGGGDNHPDPPPQTVETELNWSQGNWDEVIWR